MRGGVNYVQLNSGGWYINATFIGGRFVINEFVILLGRLGSTKSSNAHALHLLCSLTSPFSQDQFLLFYQIKYTKYFHLFSHIPILFDKDTFVILQDHKNSIRVLQIPRNVHFLMLFNIISDKIYKHYFGHFLV